MILAAVVFTLICGALSLWLIVSIKRELRRMGLNPREWARENGLSSVVSVQERIIEFRAWRHCAWIVLGICCVVIAACIAGGLAWGWS